MESLSSTQTQLTDIQRLKYLLMNEKSTTNLLPYDVELIEGICKKLHNQEEDLSNEEDKEASNRLSISLRSLEVSRIKFILSQYLRIRIKKIEKYNIYILNNPEMYALLSNDEKTYLQKYSDMVVKYFNNSFLNSIPSELREIPQDDAVIDKPDKNEFVIFKSCKDIGTVTTYGPTGEVDDFNEIHNDYVCLIRYKTIENYLKDNSGFLL